MNVSGLSPELRYEIAGPRRAIAAIRNAPANSRRRLLFVHGYGEHKEILPYQMLARAMAEAGIELHGFDLPGHGSERELPRVWSPMREDLSAVVDHVKPDAILGLSLGSIVVLDWAASTGVSTPLITLAAPLGKVSVSPMILLIGKLLSMVAPRANLSPRLGVDKVSRDEDLVRQYLGDPLFHQRATGPAFQTFFQTVKNVKRNAAAIRAPLLMLHGDADTIAKPEQRFLAWTSSPQRG
ncbi:MAG: alpha/beta hydrolase [Acidobacteria bacterium]|nr:alpha/beta hydrolase [Acidobacteriota bacterium]